MKSDEKALNIIISENEHRQLKLYSINKNKSIKKIILECLKKEGVIK